MHMKIAASAKKSVIDKLVELIERGKRAYYAGKVARVTSADIPQPLTLTLFPGPMTDAVFDQIEDLLRELDPKNPILNSVGSEEAINKKLRVKLPLPMGSLRKGKPDDGTMQKWLDTHPGPYTVSFKLDGVSLLLMYKKGQPVKLYTRGKNGVGGDISFMASALKIPQQLNVDIAVRAEMLMPLAKFKAMYERAVGSTDKAKFSNPRNMIAGITNRNDLHPALRDIDVVCYDVLSPRMVHSEALSKIKALGLRPVVYKKYANLTVSTLKKLLVDAKAKSLHELDGLVVTQDKKTPLAADYPTYAVAFKDAEVHEVGRVKVIRVEWNRTRTGLYFPRIQYEPVKLSGVICTNASGKSAEFIVANGIGPGAIIEVIRSGDVIPDFVRTVKRVKPQLPDEAFVWKGANVYADKSAAPTEHDNRQRGLAIQHFFASIGVEKFKLATIEKFMDAGYDTVRKIIQAPASKFVAVPGCSPKVLQAVMDQMDAALDGIDLPVLMGASGMFGAGFGERNCRAITEVYPNILSMAGDKDLVAKIAAVPGMGGVRATQFASNLKRFAAWLKATPQIHAVVKRQKRVTSGKLMGHVVVFTKVRDAGLESAIKAQGGTIGGSVTGKTTEVIAPAGEQSVKLDAARAKGIPVMTIDQFRKKFGL